MIRICIDNKRRCIESEANGKPEQVLSEIVQSVHFAIEKFAVVGNVSYDTAKLEIMRVLALSEDELSKILKEARNNTGKND